MANAKRQWISAEGCWRVTKKASCLWVDKLEEHKRIWTEQGFNKTVRAGQTSAFPEPEWSMIAFALWRQRLAWIRDPKSAPVELYTTTNGRRWTGTWVSGPKLGALLRMLDSIGFIEYERGYNGSATKPAVVRPTTLSTNWLRSFMASELSKAGLDYGAWKANFKKVNQADSITLSALVKPPLEQDTKQLRRKMRLSQTRRRKGAVGTIPKDPKDKDSAFGACLDIKSLDDVLSVTGEAIQSMRELLEAQRINLDPRGKMKPRNNSSTMDVLRLEGILGGNSTIRPETLIDEDGNLRPDAIDMRRHFRKSRNEDGTIDPYAWGGRYYFPLQNVPSKHRKNWRINGERFSKIDISDAHLRILFALEGKDIPWNFRSALHPAGRKAGKVVALYCVGTPKEPSRVGCNSVLRERGIEPLTRTQWREIRSILSPIWHHLGSAPENDVGAWGVAQRKESDIATLVMLWAAKAELPIIPIHDGFMMPASRFSEASEILEEAWREVLPGTNVVWKQEF